MNRIYKITHLTDIERKVAGLGSPPGRVSIRVDLIRDGIARSATEVADEISKLKDDQKAQNEAYIERTGYKPTRATNKAKSVSAAERTGSSPAQLTQLIPSVLLSAAEQYQPVYGALVLKLDPGTGNSVCVFGSSKRGKSTAMMHIWRTYYSRSVPEEGGDPDDKSKRLIPILFAKNAQISLYDSDPADKKLLRSDSFRPWVIAAQRKIQRESKNKFEFANFIDDFIDLKHSVTLDDMILTMRNSLISTVICLQYVNNLSKSGRSNVNNVLLFGQNTDEAAEVCINVYLKSWFKAQKIREVDWVPVFHKITADHGFFHVHPASGVVAICKGSSA